MGIDISRYIGYIKERETKIDLIQIILLRIELLFL